MRAKVVSLDLLVENECSDEEAPLDWPGYRRKRDRSSKLGLHPAAVELLEEEGSVSLLALWSDIEAPPLE
jgi:hypothetical protein